MSEREPEISVIMPTWRRADQIGCSLRTLLDGAFQDFELLVRDDGNGHDGTEEAVTQSAQEDPRVRYYRNPHNLGLPENVNSGIRAARGRYIAICHDHDLYKPAFLAKMRQALLDHPTALFVHCAIDVIDRNGNYVTTHRGSWPSLSVGREWLRVMLRSLSCPVCGLAMVRRETHEQHGLYDTKYGFVADVELWMRLSAAGDVAYVPTPLIGVRQRETDHYLNEMGSRLALSVYAMHRRYAGLAYDGVNAQKKRAHSFALLAKAIALNVLSTCKRGLRRRFFRT